MDYLGIQRLLLCAVVLASASEQPQLREIVPTGSDGYFCSVDGDESKFDNYVLEASLASQPSTPLLDTFNCYAPVDEIIVRVESVVSTESRLRGPPRFSLG